MELNKSQLQAVCHDKGPMMVLAGPGSGKTMVITHRVKWLIEHAGVHPYPGLHHGSDLCWPVYDK